MVKLKAPFPLPSFYHHKFLPVGGESHSYCTHLFVVMVLPPTCFVEVLDIFTEPPLPEVEKEEKLECVCIAAQTKIQKKEKQCQISCNAKQHSHCSTSNTQISNVVPRQSFTTCCSCMHAWGKSLRMRLASSVNWSWLL